MKSPFVFNVPDDGTRFLKLYILNYITSMCLLHFWRLGSPEPRLAVAFFPSTWWCFLDLTSQIE